jgi:ABC-type branched-subunit amino acid transport system substrate-binding protein
MPLSNHLLSLYLWCTVPVWEKYLNLERLLVIVKRFLPYLLLITMGYRPLTASLSGQEQLPETPALAVEGEAASEVEPEKKIRSVKLVLDDESDSLDVTEGSVQLVGETFSREKISFKTSLTNKENHILLNATMPTTGAMGLVGRDFVTGINLVFDKVNQTGGFEGGALIRYSMLDDKHQSTLAKKNVMKGLDRSPFFIGNYGSSLLAELKQIILSSAMLTLFPVAGDNALRKPEFRYMLHFRPSVEREIESLVTYAINEKHRRKIAVFYEESNWGKAGLNAVRNALKKYDLEIAAQGYYPAGTVNVMSAVREIVKNKPEAIVCVSTYRPSYTFIQQVLNEGFQNCLFLGLGPAAPMQGLIKKSRGVIMATSSVVPDPEKSMLPIVQQYRKDMARYFPYRDLSQYSLEGYIVGALFVAALRKLSPPYTVGKLVRYFEKVRKKNFGGLRLDFKRETRELSSSVWINKGDGSEWSLQS